MNATCLAIIIAIAATGCASLHEDRFTARPSPLDYVQFRMSRISPVSGIPETIRLDLSGSGFLEITTGASERVRESFWKESDNPAWQDLHRDHTFLHADETAAAFQALVNAGIFDHRHDPRQNPPPHDLAVLAAIGSRKRLVLTGQAAYHRIFEILLERVRQP